MKKSTGDNLLPSSVTNFAEGMQMLKRAGFDGVELWLGERPWFQVKTSDADVLRLRRQAEDAGLQVSNVANSLDWEQNVSARDPAKREAAFNHIRRQMETAQLLGTDAILIVAGLVGEQAAYNEVYKRTVEALQELALDAEKARVKIGVENCNAEQHFLLSPREFNAFLDDVHHPFVGIHLDVGNIHDTGFAEQWIEILGPRITRVHVKDVLKKRGRCGQQSVYTNIFLGDNNWMAIREALDKVSYNGWMIAEMESRYRFAPDQQLFDTSAALTRLISRQL
jgi:L-ribulose-5-phosphate 3-epimerase